jgi:hypothetical protein
VRQTPTVAGQTPPPPYPAVSAEFIGEVVGEAIGKFYNTMYTSRSGPIPIPPRGRQDKAPGLDTDPENIKTRAKKSLRKKHPVSSSLNVEMSTGGALLSRSGKPTPASRAAADKFDDASLDSQSSIFDSAYQGDESECSCGTSLELSSDDPGPEADSPGFSPDFLAAIDACWQ